MFKPLSLERILCQKCAHGLGHVGAHLIPLILFLEAHDCARAAKVCGHQKMSYIVQINSSKTAGIHLPLLADKPPQPQSDHLL